MKSVTDFNSETEKSAAVFAVRRANYTHRRKGVFNVANYSGSEAALAMCGVVLKTEAVFLNEHQKMSKKCYFRRFSRINSFLRLTPKQLC